MKKLLVLALALVSMFGFATQSFALPSSVTGTVTLNVTGAAEFTLVSYRWAVLPGGTTPTTDYVNSNGNLDFGSIDATDGASYPDPLTNPYLSGVLYLAAPAYYEVRYTMANNVNPYKVTILFSDAGQTNGLFTNIKGPQNYPSCTISFSMPLISEISPILPITLIRCIRRISWAA